MLMNRLVLCSSFSCKLKLRNSILELQRIRASKLSAGLGLHRRLQACIAANKFGSDIDGSTSKRRLRHLLTPSSNSVSRDHDAILILAGGQRTDGNLHTWVRRRMELAADLFLVQEKPEVKLLCCGGGTPHRPPVLMDSAYVLHEASELADHLCCEGVRRQDLLKEVASYDTIGNAYFALTSHVIPAEWRSLGIVTSAFHMPRSRAIFEAMIAATEMSLGKQNTFDLTFYSASDEGVFTDDVILARQQREANSLAAWNTTRASFTNLASIHAWLTAEHMCYSVQRQKSELRLWAHIDAGDSITSCMSRRSHATKESIYGISASDGFQQWMAGAW